MAPYPEKFPKFPLPERVAINLLREFRLRGAFCWQVIHRSAEASTNSAAMLAGIARGPTTAPPVAPAMPQCGNFIGGARRVSGSKSSAARLAILTFR